MEEIGNVTHLEVKVNGVNKRPVRVNMKPVDSRVRQPRPRKRLFHSRDPLVPATDGGGEDVLLGGGSRRQADEAEGGHDGLELVVGHNGLEGSGVPEGQLPRTASHVVFHCCCYVLCLKFDFFWFLSLSVFLGKKIGKKIGRVRRKKKELECRDLGEGKWVEILEGVLGRGFERGLVACHPSW